MDIDNIQQNMNTRVVFKEPRGMIRWLQLFFAIVALSLVSDFYTTVGINITCPISSTTTTTTTTTTSTTTSTTAKPASSSSAPAPISPSPSPAPAPASSPASASIIQAPAITKNLTLQIAYPFDFSQQNLTNDCPGHKYVYTHQTSLESSPQFFVFTGAISLIFAAATLAIYLFGSTTYHSIPMLPVVDLIVTALLCLLWLLAASTFSSGVSMLKNSAHFGNLFQTLCPPAFEMLPGADCQPGVEASWKSINIGLISGFTSCFLWGAGLWFVFKETHFHTPRDQFGPTR